MATLRHALVLAVLLPLSAHAARPEVAPAAVAELSRRPDAPLILDVRTPEEFAAGHVAGAVNIPHDQVAARLDELRGERWVLVYCRSGARAAIAEKAIAGAGIEVRKMEGSWLRWQAEGRPVAGASAEAGE